MWLTLVAGSVVNGSHCISPGSAIDCSTVYRVDSTNMSFLCYHGSILRNKDVGILLGMLEFLLFHESAEVQNGVSLIDG